MRLVFNILGYRNAQRYVVRRAINQALLNLASDQIEPEVKIEETSDVSEILKYTQVLIYPSVMLNNRLICVGRIPKQDEMKHWVLEEISSFP